MSKLLKRGTAHHRQSTATDLAPLNIIRIETVLSKLPIHNLAKRGRVNISITQKNADGEVTLEWNVSANERYGEPRQLAYKLDTLVINRRFDETGRPLPKVIRLDTLREMAHALSLGSDTSKVKKALLQNAFAGITAKLTYTTKDGRKKRIEAAFVRYSVVFTGETLPDGTTADAVYLVLNDIFWEILNNAQVRPLDYDYLGQLLPAPQRFYELMSYRFYATIKYGRAHAKILYSEYCTFAAQQRYYEYELFKNQMYNVHKPHRDSSYIAKIRYEATTDQQEKQDWWMYYTPGPKAYAEFETFHPKRSKLPTKSAEPDGINAQPEAGQAQTRMQPALQTEPTRKALVIVNYFYHLFHGTSNVDPSPRELQQALELVTTYGIDRTRYIVDYAYQVALHSGYRPQFFGGVLPFTSRALAHFEEAQAHKQAEQAIRACTLCDDQGRIIYIESNGHSFSAYCPHDLEQIQAREQADGLRRTS
jgi:hypothetical protein